MNGWKTIVASVVSIVFTGLAIKGIDVAAIVGLDSGGVADLVVSSISSALAIWARVVATKKVGGGELT